jgi:hypothetical protein
MGILKTIATKTTLITLLMFSGVTHAELVTMIAEWKSNTSFAEGEISSGVGEVSASGTLTFDTDDLNSSDDPSSLGEGYFDLNFEVFIGDEVIATLSAPNINQVILHKYDGTPLDFSPEAGNLIGSQIITGYPDGIFSGTMSEASDPVYIEQVLANSTGEFNFYAPNAETGAVLPNVWMTGFEMYSYSEGVVDRGELFFTATRLENIEAVPVPAAAWLFGSALAGLSVIRKNK